MYKNKKGYSIIIALIVIGFLLILTSSVFKLVLAELYDNRGRYDYLKSIYATEGAGELVMLKIKNNGYGYYEKTDFDENNPFSNIYSNSGEKNLLVSYDIGSKVSSYSGEINPLGYDIIPLFYLEESGSGSAINLDFKVDLSSENYISWNILSNNAGLSGTGNFDLNKRGYLKLLDANGDFLVEEKTVGDFFQTYKNNYNYLVLFNSNSGSILKYNLKDTNFHFTKPRTDILVSAKKGKYKQNIRLKYDNTEYLGLLKYSIFSN